MVSNNFIEECKNRANANRLGQIIVDGVENPITQSDSLQSFEIDSGCYVDGNIVGSVYVKCLKANFIAEQNNLNDRLIQAKIGVKYADLSEEYINMGEYKVERPNNEITANMSKITAYSVLYTNLDNKYVCSIDYSLGNITLSDLYIDVCNQLELIPVTSNFINSTIPIKANPFTNGEKNRTVLQTIAKIACSFVDIDNNTGMIDLCWLSESEEPDYIFYENDYSSVEGGQVVCGPINCLIIKNSQIDDENVTIKDEESIALYGEHSITISEDYILYNAELREQAITSIWNRVKGMKYVDCKLTTYYGKPFLKLGNKIRIYISETDYFDTYVLTHNFVYDGAFTSIIESPALTEQEIKTKQDISLGQALRNTQIEVDKQNQKIESVISQTDEQNEKIAKVTQTVEELNSKISDIADITTSAEDTDAKIELNEINQSEPIRLVVRPIGESISNLVVSSNMLISDNLKLKQRVIRFTNTNTNEIFDYSLPDDLFYYDSENYDEFILDYDGQSCVINKKVGINEDGTVYLLETPTTIEYEFPTGDKAIVLTEGDYIVEILGYGTGYIFARLMSKNIYTTQFYTKAEVDSEISQTAQSINLSVNNKLSNYSTTTEMNSAISLKANEITSSVSETYATKTTTNQLSSRISQTAKTIELTTTDNKTSAGITIKLKNEDGTEIDSKSANITMTGLVKFTDLSTSGSTTINGSNIVTGTLDASKVNVTNLNANNITTGTISAATIKLKGTTLSPSSSKIGGWTINTDNFSSGDSTIKANGEVYFYPQITNGGILALNTGFRCKAPKGVAIYNDTAYFGTDTIQQGITLLADSGNLNIAQKSINYGINIRSYCSPSVVSNVEARSILLAAGNNIFMDSVNGSVWAHGNGLANARVKTDAGSSSSKNVKSNIIEFNEDKYDKSLKLLDKMKIYSYDYKYNLYKNPHQFGFIIDELEEFEETKDFFEFEEHEATIKDDKIDFSGSMEGTKLKTKTYNSDVLNKYLLTCCKAMYNKIKELEVKLCQ